MDKMLENKKFEKLTERWVFNAVKVIESCVKSINLDVTDINHFVKSQLSKHETLAIAKKLNINLEQIHNTTEHCGHLGHADILYNLHTTLQNKELRNMDIIALVSSHYDCSAGAIILRR
jgi:3-oxoacyl-[acyl-carrier-protein] synthase III